MYGIGYIDASGVERYGPAPDPTVPIPDQTSNQIGYLWDAVFGGGLTPYSSGDPGMSVPTQSAQWISGVPNWVTGVCGGVAALVLFKTVSR